MNSGGQDRFSFLFISTVFFFALFRCLHTSLRRMTYVSLQIQIKSDMSIEGLREEKARGIVRSLEPHQCRKGWCTTSSFTRGSSSAVSIRPEQDIRGLDTLPYLLEGLRKRGMASCFLFFLDEKTQAIVYGRLKNMCDQCIFARGAHWKSRPNFKKRYRTRSKAVQGITWGRRNGIRVCTG